MTEEVWLWGLQDEATLRFNFNTQETELRALNQHTGRGAMRTYADPIHDPSALLPSGVVLLDDMNDTLAGWGWTQLTRAQWSGVNHWAAKLIPADL